MYKSSNSLIFESCEVLLASLDSHILVFSCYHQHITYKSYIILYIVFLFICILLSVPFYTIMPSAFNGYASRAWTIPITETDLCKIELNHSFHSGELELSVDGNMESVPKCEVGILSSTEQEITFPVRNDTAILRIFKEGTRFLYDITWGGKLWMPDHTRADRNECLVHPTLIEGVRIRIPAYDITWDSQSKRVPFFIIEIERTSDGFINRVHRRFSEFFSTWNACCAVYAGSATASRIPSPPSRKIPFFTNHLDPDFLNSRRVALQDWMQQMERVPGMLGCSAFAALIGVMDMTRESSAVFQDGPIGLRLAAVAGGLGSTVQDFVSKADGTPGAGQASGAVAIGDRLSKIAGEPVLANLHDGNIAALKNRARPVILHFLGYTMTAEADAAAAAARKSPMRAATAAAAASTSASAATVSPAASSPATPARSPAPAPAPAVPAPAPAPAPAAAAASKPSSWAAVAKAPAAEDAHHAAPVSTPPAADSPALRTAEDALLAAGAAEDDTPDMFAEDAGDDQADVATVDLFA